MLKSVFVDWPDDAALTVLRRIREVIPENGSLLMIGSVLPETVTDDLPALTYLFDLNGLVNVGGLQCTEEDFAQLCRAAGCHAPTITPMPGFCLIEAAPDQTATVDS